MQGGSRWRGLRIWTLREGGCSASLSLETLVSSAEAWKRRQRQISHGREKSRRVESYALVGEQGDLAARDIEALLLGLGEEGAFIHRELGIVDERIGGVVVLLCGVLL